MNGKGSDRAPVRADRGAASPSARGRHLRKLRLPGIVVVCWAALAVALAATGTRWATTAWARS
ncbi:MULTISPECIES: hypothetical protein [unclassified Streptomyces]|uniref:hypothetical protein n=1 Tax=unclassified Streptomyces TaxID=2593676 RepID=UPI0012FEB56D|nr:MULTISPECIES: hypothetical protein [unclassified Streptomyces]